MNAMEFLVGLKRSGIKISLEGGKLRCEAAKGALTESIRRNLSALKPEIIRILSGMEAEESGPPLPIPRSSGREAFPLSHSQRRIWVLEKMAGGATAYNMGSAAWLEGRWDEGLLGRCFRELVHREETLRTVIRETDGEPEQVILPFPDAEMRVEDLFVPDPESVDALVEERCRAEFQRPFDLGAGPLIRLKLFRLGGGRWAAVLATHHIVSDGLSMEIFFRELRSLYEGYASAGHFPERKPSIRYADYAVWQDSPQREEILGRQVSYWTERLQGCKAGLALPWAGKGKGPAGRAESLSFRIGPETLASIRAACGRQGASLFSGFLAAFQVLLQRYSGQQDLNVGTPVANRPHPDLEGVMGFFSNTVVLRARFGDDPSFAEFLARTAESVSGALLNQEAPFERVAEAVDPDRSGDGNPLFQAAFVMQPAYRFDGAAGGLTLRPIRIGNASAKFDVTLTILEGEKSCEGSLEFRADRWDSSGASRFVRRFTTLLAVVAARQDMRISAIPLDEAVEPAESAFAGQSADAFAWNRPPLAGLDGLLSAHAAIRPDAVAISAPGIDISYRELENRSQSVSRMLKEKSIAPMERIGIVARPVPEWVIGLAGILNAGCVPVPIEPGWPAADLSAMASRSGIRYLLTTSGLEKTVAGDPAIPPFPGAAVIGADPGSIHGLFQELRTALPLDATDTVACCGGEMAAAMPWLTLWPISMGARLWLQEDRPSLEPGEIRAWAVKESLTAVLLPGPLREPGTPDRADKHETSRLKYLLTAGGFAAGPVAAGRRRSGLAETEIEIYAPSHWSGPVALRGYRSGNDVGAPENTFLRGLAVLDGGLAPLGPGLVGEIHTAGTVAGRWLATGDLARIRDDGAFERLGCRAPSAWNGYGKIDCGVLARMIEYRTGARDCVVVSAVDRGGVPVTAAYLVAPGESTPESVRERLASAFPASLVPRVIAIVPSIPLDADGEPDASRLLRQPAVSLDSIQAWESELERVAGIKKAAGALLALRERPTEIHASELFRDWNPVQAIAEASGPGAGAHAGVVANGVPDLPVSGRLSLSEGGLIEGATGFPRTLADALLKTAEASAKGIVYIGNRGSTRRLEYAGLVSEARAILGGLLSEGLAPSDIVLLQLPLAEDFLPAFWACILGGLVPVPYAAPADGTYDGAALGKLAAACGILGKPAILCGGGSDGALREGLERSSYSRLLPVAGMRACAPAAFTHAGQEADIALIMMTSGSTGIPKGVGLTHRSLIERTKGSAQLNGFSGSDVSLNWMPLDHVGGLIYFHIRDVILGCEQVQLPTAQVLEDPLRWMDAADAYGATITFAPNFGFALFNQAAALSAGRTWELSRLRAVLNGAEPIVARTARSFLRLLAPFGLREGAIRPAFGMTETSSGITYGLGFSLSSTTDDDAFVDVGVPIPGVALRIVDENDCVLPEGETGRLQIRGTTVMSGYFRAPDETRAAFCPDGWLITGDLAFLREGSLTICGRAKDVVILNGVNHHCHEIERIVEQVEGVEPSFTAAFAVRGPASETDALAVVFRTEEKAEARIAGILTAISAKLAEGLGTGPRFLVPVEKQDVAKTSLGKIQRAKVKQAFLTGGLNGALKRVDALTGGRNSVEDWFFRQVWIRKNSRGAGELDAPRGVLVFMDGEGLAERLCDAFEAAGGKCVRVYAGTGGLGRMEGAFSLAPGDGAGFAEFFSAYAAEGFPPISHVLHLWCATGGDSGESAECRFESARDAGILSLLHIVRGVAALNTAVAPVRLCVATRSSFATDDNSPLAWEFSAVSGFLKSLALEMPWMQVQQIDLQAASDPGQAAAIFAESTAPLRDDQVSFRAGKRMVPALVKAAMPVSAVQDIPFRKGGFYVVAGGLGGIGAEICKYLMTAWQAKVLVLGRTELPPRGEWAGILGEAPDQASGKTAKRIRAYLQLESAGERFRYRSVDIAQSKDVANAVREAEAGMGSKLAGVLNLAGEGHLVSHWENSVRHGLLAETPATFVSMMRAKAHGTIALHGLLDNHPELPFICFSSVNGVFGGATFGAYAAANAFMDGYCRHLLRSGFPNTHCFDWTMWEGTGMSEGAPAFAEAGAKAMGYSVLPRERGLLSFLAALASKHRHLLIGLDGRNPAIGRHLAEGGRPRFRLRFHCEGDETALEALRKSGTIYPDAFGMPLRPDYHRSDKLPLLPDGRIDRVRLSQAGSVGAGGGDTSTFTPIQKSLAEIWEKVLGRRVADLDAGFFDLGGHSLSATRAAAMISDATGAGISIRDLFLNPTLRTLSAFIDSGSGAASHKAPRIPVVSRDGDIPTSFSQRRLWFLDKLEPGNPAYNIHMALRLLGDLHAEVLAAGLDRLVSRHDALRTTFVERDGEGFQTVAPHKPFAVVRISIAEVPAAFRSGRLRDLLAGGASRRMDLETGPLISATLIHVSETEHVLQIVLHHIIADGWSMAILIRELGTVYSALSQGAEARLPPLPIQFPDYAAWQRADTTLPETVHRDSYWKARLADGVPPLSLPLDFPRPAVQAFNGAELHFRLPPALADGITSLASGAGATPFMVALAGLSILLSRYSGSPRVAIGIPAANRALSGTEGIVGFFANTLVMISDLSGEPTFFELLARIRDAALGTFTHQDFPFEKAVEIANPPRDTSRNPLFDVMLQFQNLPIRPIELTGLRLEPIEDAYDPVSKFDLTWTLWEESGGLNGSLVYNTALFLPATAERMIRHFRNLLEWIVASPGEAVASAAMMDAESREEALAAGNVPWEHDPEQGCLHELFEASARIHPGSVAVSCTGESWSYADLEIRSNQIAHYLQSLGVVPGSKVGVCLERGIVLPAILLGVLKAGGAYVPLDPSYPVPRLSLIAERSGIGILITSGAGPLAIGLPAPCKLELEQAWPEILAMPWLKPKSAASPEDLAYIMHTSGSTGIPKGVQIEHRNVVNFLLGMLKRPGMAAGERCLAVTSLSFDISVLEIFLPLASGGTVVIATREEAKSAPALAKALEEERIDLMQATPATWNMLLESGWRNEAGIRILCGGEAMAPMLAERLCAIAGQVWNLYGPTETTVWSAAKRIRMDGNPVTIGTPVRNTRLYVLDEAGEPVPIGVIGELCIGGDGLARGYLGQAAQTAAAFRPDPFQGRPGARLYRTGDLARILPGGEVLCLGRRDNQVKIRGHRIEPGEIEAAMLTHRDVLQSAVVAKGKSGGEAPILVAYVLVAEGAAPSATDLKEHLRKRLPEHMVPSHILFPGAFPHTPNGKIDKSQLAGRDDVKHRGPAGTVPPRTDTEARLAAIWREILDLDVVGVTEDFFDLGGHSLTITRMLSRIRKDFGTEPPIRALFEARTIAELAIVIEATARIPAETTAQNGMHGFPIEEGLI